MWCHISREVPSGVAVLGELGWYSCSLLPRPSPKSRKRDWCSEQLFLSHGAGSNGIKNVIITFGHALHAACKMIPSCAVCTIALPVFKGVAPLIQHLPLTRGLWNTLLLLISWTIELANSSLCKACFTKLKKVATYLATAENITNKLWEKFALGL